MVAPLENKLINKDLKQTKKKKTFSCLAMKHMSTYPIHIHTCQNKSEYLILFVKAVSDPFAYVFMIS